MPPARGGARRAEGVRRAPEPRSRRRRLQTRGVEAAAAPAALSMAPEEVTGDTRRAPRPPGREGRGRAEGVRGWRRWSGGFNLPGGGGGRIARLTVGEASPRVPEVPPLRHKSCPWFKNCSLGITVREPGLLSPPLTLLKTSWLRR